MIPRRAALIAAVLLLAGCGGAGDDESGRVGGPVTVQVFGGAEELGLYREVIAAYRERTGEEVRLVPVADREDHLQKLATSFAGGAPPSAFLINYRNFATFADRDVLDQVGPRLAEDDALRRDAFYPQPLEAFTYRDQLTCLPQNASSLVVFYNRALFAQAGVPEPSADWTYDEFRRAAVRLTKGGVYGVGVEPETQKLAAFVWTRGGDLVDDARTPTRFTLDSPQARAGLEDLLDLQAGVRAAPLETEVESKPFEDRFIEGKLAMFLSSRRDVPAFRAVERLDWDVAAFPRRDRPATVLHSDAWCISKGGSADAAWRFVRFAAGPEGQRLLARGGRIVPSLKAVAASREFLDPSRRPRRAQVFLDGIEHVRRLPVSPRWPEIEDAADLAIKRAYYTELSVEDALVLIREETDELFARGG